MALICNVFLLMFAAYWVFYRGGEFLARAFEHRWVLNLIRIFIAALLLGLIVLAGSCVRSVETPTRVTRPAYEGRSIERPTLQPFYEEPAPRAQLYFPEAIPVDPTPVPTPISTPTPKSTPQTLWVSR